MKKNKYTSPLYQATRRLIESVFLALLLTGCVNDAYVGGEDINGPAVSFSTNTGGGTRAVGADAATLLGNTFTVFGSKKVNGGEQPVFPGYVVNYTAHTAGTTNSNSADWEYVGINTSDGTQLIKYWDLGADKYYFSAYSLGQGDAEGKATATPTVSSNALLDSYTLSGTAAQLAACYITNKQEVTSAQYRQAVQLRFFTLTAKLRIGLYETIPGYSVKDVQFYPAASLPSDASLKTNATLFANSDIIPNEGTYRVRYDNNGKVMMFFLDEGSQKKSNIDTGALTNYVNQQIAEADGNYLGRTSNASTITGYQSTLPNPGGCALNLKVNYTLVSTDGSGQEIHVKGASAIVPASYADWKSNYAYTYLFKINDNTNGSTGGSTDPAGLYPISFDAWTAADGANTQGTITTFGDYSITTYQEGDVDGEGVGYAAEKKLDIIVMKNDNDTPTQINLDGTNNKVRVVLQTSNNESDVETTYPTEKEQTVDHNNGKASFTPPVAGYYRVEYWENALIAVKIVKVGEADITAASLQASDEVDQDYRHVKKNTITSCFEK